MHVVVSVPCVNMCDVFMFWQVHSGAAKVRDKQSVNGAGYLSDGHVSSRSSDNESSSVCSEMVGRATDTSSKCSLSLFAFVIKH